MNAPLVLILADDVTGMADCAARCRSAGLPATIWLGTPDGVSLHEATLQGAAAFTSDSRRLPPEAAAARVRELVAHLSGAAGTDEAIWYKKIDSTLRGNLGAELDAILDVRAAKGDPACALVVPAFPAQRRGLEDGYLVHTGTPPQTVHLPSLLSSQSRRKVAAVDLATVRGGSARLAAALRANLATGAQLFAVDGMDDVDLEAVLVAAQEVMPDALLCGSAGLIGVLARRLAGAPASIATQVTPRAPLAASIALVAGSGSPMAQHQIATLVAHGQVNRLVVTAEGSEALRPCRAPHQDWLIHLPAPPPGATLEGPTARALAARLADEATRLIAQESITTLILAGGDTATTVLDQLGIARLDVLRELQPGIPLTTGQSADGRRLAVVLKSGNHGTENTLVDLVRDLRGEN